ncbi:hypothetical protein ABFB09_08610 [Dehalogenimonas sp. THU2]|uniref:hypothetical protein n=1 Tax=Dehalogenimonas sp. THU2 TaxID=3151121 RepID=UPI003218B352
MTSPVTKTLPPYVSYRTFWNFLDGLKAAVPSRIDRSFWGDKLSGSTGGQLIAALKYLKLIDGTGVPTLRLRQIVFAKGPQRAGLLQQLTQEAYPFFIEALDPAAATYSQLEEKLRENFQITTDVGRKCIKFYIGLAEDAGIGLSPFVTRKSKILKTSAPARKPKKTAPPPSANGNNGHNPYTETASPSTEDGPTAPSVNQTLLNMFPAFDPTWTDEIKLRWFEAFDKLQQKVRTRD